MFRFLSSLKTTLALVAALVALSVLGSFQIQARPDDYATIESSILFDWLRTQGKAQPAASWWIFGMIAVAALLSVNTVVCVVLRFSRALKHRSLNVRAVSAHLAHLGFLLVLAGHLIGSVAGFRSDNHSTFAGGRIQVPERADWTIDIGQMHTSYSPQGCPVSLDAYVSVRGADRLLAQGTVWVNHPLVIQGVAVYLKNAEPTLKGLSFHVQGDLPALAEIGKPVRFNSGTLLLADWARADQGLAVQVLWSPVAGAPQRGWVFPTPGRALALQQGPVLIWGEIAVEPLGTFDVRYDPGAPLALAGGIMLSVSLLPLLLPLPRTAHRWSRRRAAVGPSTLESPSAAIIHDA